MIAVTGIPRSGTSLLMQMLSAGGVPVGMDGARQADEDNPKGYFENEYVKLEDPSWAKHYAGDHAIKIITFHLPKYKNYSEKILWVFRDLEEVFDSSNKMLKRNNKEPLDRKIVEIWERHLMETKAWVEESKIPCLMVGHHALIKKPQDSAKRIKSFLKMDLDVDAMADVVDPDLYRNRS
jgi:hypothetical protein